MPQIVTV